MHLRPSQKRRPAHILLLLLALAAPLVVAEVSRLSPAAAAAEAASPAAAADLPSKRAKVADEIAQLTKTKQAAVAAGEAAGAVDPADEEIELLGALDLVYVQLQAVSEHHEELGWIGQVSEASCFQLPRSAPFLRIETCAARH